MKAFLLLLFMTNVSFAGEFKDISLKIDNHKNPSNKYLVCVADSIFYGIGDVYTYVSSTLIDYDKKPSLKAAVSVMVKDKNSGKFNIYNIIFTSSDQNNGWINVQGSDGNYFLYTSLLNSNIYYTDSDVNNVLGGGSFEWCLDN